MEKTEDGFWVDEHGQKYLFRPDKQGEKGEADTDSSTSSDDSRILWEGANFKE